jgi:hypothetical protein
MEPYPVYFEKEGEFVAEFKYTVLLMPNGTMKITGLPIDLDSYQTENQIVDESIKVFSYFAMPAILNLRIYIGIFNLKIFNFYILS